MCRERFSAVVSIRPPPTQASMWSTCGTRPESYWRPKRRPERRLRKSNRSCLPLQSKLRQSRPLSADILHPTVTIRMTYTLSRRRKTLRPCMFQSMVGWRCTALQATTFLTTVFQASNYWVDVLFAPPSSATWISGTNVVATPDGANITWTTAVQSTSQVEYGPTTASGNTTVLAPAKVASHSVTLSGLQAGTYHFRVRSSDPDAVLAAGLDYTLALSLPVTLSVSPSSVSVVSGKTQQLTAIVYNTQNPAVTWSATAGNVGSSGLFTAPTVTSTTQVKVIATSQADSSKSADRVCEP